MPRYAAPDALTALESLRMAAGTWTKPPPCDTLEFPCTKLFVRFVNSQALSHPPAIARCILVMARFQPDGNKAANLLF